MQYSAVSYFSENGTSLCSLARAWRSKSTFISHYPQEPNQSEVLPAPSSRHPKSFCSSTPPLPHSHCVSPGLLLLPTCSHSFLSFSRAEHPSHSGCSHVTWCKKWTFFAPVLLKHQYQVPKQVSGKSSQPVFQKKSSVTFSSYLESLSPILNKKESDKKRI